eukprot:TRINITY_DN794_c0_g1_i5.p1 TRINITY_DN794_c0_g1~~TRINITY_DN794_c0_g1_i5.p1  ORF type:complete len:140 (-),score=18.83 TRINITY_DN794_c0_g1_i5:416-835(-)
MEPPLPGYRQFDLTDPYELRAGPFWFHPSTLRSAFKAEGHHCNSQGIVHGGCLMSFADFSLFVTALKHTFDSTGVPYVTVSFNIDFIASARQGAVIEASGMVEKVSAGADLIFLNSRIMQGTKTIAVFRSVVKAVRPKL